MLMSLTLTFPCLLISCFFRFVFEGLPYFFDQVYVQGKNGTNRSVSQYYLSTSNDDDVYATVKVAGGENLRVRFINKLFMNLNSCIL